MLFPVNVRNSICVVIKRVNDRIAKEILAACNIENTSKGQTTHRVWTQRYDDIITELQAEYISRPKDDMENVIETPFRIQFLFYGGGGG